MPSVILHVDMDAFFASVEQREDPSIRGLPVIVGADPKGGRGRGVVAACSYEARRYGIHSAQPISQAYRLCPEGVYRPPQGRLYAQISAAIMKILRGFSDRVEPISIDEAFVDATGSQRLFGSPTQIALRIKHQIQQDQQLSASIGVASNKFLAKIASDLEKPDGLVMVTPGKEADFLRDLPVRRMWGVGPKTEARLLQLGIKTIGDVGRHSEEYWDRRFGRHGVHLWRLSQGQDDRHVIAHQGFKSLSHERTFSEDTADLELISKTLLQLSEDVSRRSRKNSAQGRCVTLKWRYSDFSTLSRQTTLREPTSDPLVIFRAAWKLVQQLKPFPQRIRLVGISLSRFEPAPISQLVLFDKSRLGEGVQGSKGPIPKPEAGPGDPQNELNHCIDAINQKFGSGKVQRASLLDREDDEDEGFSSFLIR